MAASGEGRRGGGAILQDEKSELETTTATLGKATKVRMEGFAIT